MNGAAVRGILAAAVFLISAADVSAQSCTVSVTSVAFGTYDVFSPAPADSTGTIVYRCDKRAKPITISLSQGNGGSFFPRRMTKGSETLSYNLFLDAARTSAWGDGTGGTFVYSVNNPPNNRDVTVTIFGRIPASQDVSTGNYSDSLSATIDF